MNATVDRLRAEGESLDALVAALEPGDWARPTPAAGWSIAHQVGHLQWTDEVALLAVRDPTAFVEVLAGAAGRPSIVDDEAAARAGQPPAALLSRWRSGRELLATALATATEQVPWFGPPMSPRSMTTARIMETWAHGQDVADALGVPRDLSDRLHDVAHLGVRTRDFSLLVTQRRERGQLALVATGADADQWLGIAQAFAGPPKSVVRGARATAEGLQE